MKKPSLIQLTLTDVASIISFYESENFHLHNDGLPNIEETHTYFGATPTISQWRFIRDEMKRVEVDMMTFMEITLDSGQISAVAIIDSGMFPVGVQRLDHTPIQLISVGDKVVSARMRAGEITSIHPNEFEEDDYTITITWVPTEGGRAQSMVHHNESHSITLISSPSSVPPPEQTCLLEYRLIKTVKRITFDILFQHESITYKGAPDSGGVEFTASNGFTVITENRMDLDTRRVWLHGSCTDQTSIRSGTKVFDCDENRDIAFDNYVQAINEWASHNNGYAVLYKE